MKHAMHAYWPVPARLWQRAGLSLALALCISAQAAAGPMLRPGQVITALPSGTRSVPYGGHDYFYGSGIWMLPAAGGRYVVALPPPGPVVAELPAGYQSYWVGPDLYFYANGVTYIRELTGGYRVVSAQAGAAPAAANQGTQDTDEAAPRRVRKVSKGKVDGLYVYPARKQGKAQTRADRQACIAWGREEADYDPATDAEDEQAFEDFQRAVSACLEARGYTVR